MFTTKTTISKEKLSRDTRSTSLPRLKSDHTEPRLFYGNKSVREAQRLLMQRLSEDEKEEESFDSRPTKTRLPRSFIQLPREEQQEGFTAFKNLNRNYPEELFEELKRIRSKSTLLKPVLKAEILLNKANYEKMLESNNLQVSIERNLLAKRLKEMNSKPKIRKEMQSCGKSRNKNKEIKMVKVVKDTKIYNKNVYAWKPYIDFHAMPLAHGDEVYFLGGRKEGPVVVYNAELESWREEHYRKSVKCFGETDPCIFENSKILSFGGYEYLQPGHTLMVNNLKIIDKTTFNVTIEQFDEEIVPCLAHHSQCIYGRFLIVSGGMNKNHKMMNTFMSYNFDNNVWNQISIFRLPANWINGFANHRMLPIFHKREKYSIDKNNPITAIDENVKVEGVYILGGEDALGNMLSGMHILKLGKNTLSVHELQTSGPCPPASKQTYMVRNKEFVIVHGGRDQSKGIIFNTLHLLQLKNLEWLEVKNDDLPRRHSHTMSMVREDRLLIMGGKNVEGLTKEVFVFQLEYSYDL